LVKIISSPEKDISINDTAINHNICF
jgi:hypothetical protein